MDKQQCSAYIIPRDRYEMFHSPKCTRTAKVEREGKWYCTTHDPINVKLRQEKQHLTYLAKTKEDASQYHSRELLAMLEKILPSAEAHINHLSQYPDYFYEVEIGLKEIAEAKELIAKAKGEK